MVSQLADINDRECRERSDFTHVQSDLTPHSPQNKFMVTKGKVRVTFIDIAELIKGGNDPVIDL